MRCLPAALLLSPRGCNAAAAFGRALSTAFPHVVDALKEILELDDKDVEKATGNLTDVLERSRKL